MEIATALDEFIRSEVASTLTFQGTWGRGKTHLWNDRWNAYCAEKRAEGISPRRYAYVSLFGLNSISEVRVALGLAALENDALAVSKPKESFFRGVLAKVTRATTQISAEIPTVGVGTVQLAQIFANSRTKEILACFDDIERRGKDLSIRDVLGLVSDLNSQRGCSVVVILNDASLGEDQSEWDANREKVFSSHLTFAPSSSECVSLVFSNEMSDPLMSDLASALIKLRLTNIRIAERTRTYMHQVLAMLGESKLTAGTRQKLAHSLALICHCYFGHGEGAPTLKYAVSHGAYSSYLRSKEATVSEQEKSWADFLDGYGFYLDDAVDKVLCDLVINGHVDAKRAIDAVEHFEQAAAHASARDDFHRVWDLWRLTFQENRDEVIGGFAKAFAPAAEFLSAQNADSSFQLLRSLGEDELVDKSIEIWLQYRVGERAVELRPESLNEFEPLRDPRFISRASEELSRIGPTIVNFGDAIMKLGARNGYNREDVESIAQASPDELVRFLLSNSGRMLGMGVKATLELGGDEINDLAASRMKESLLLLGARSPYEADRIRRIYGVVVPAPAEES